LISASIILEAASYSFSQNSEDNFIVLLKNIKDIIIYDNPYIYAIKFLQYIIHSSGYDYEYQKYDKIETPLELLSYLYYTKDAINLDLNLIEKTLIKIIHSFENKFDCQLKSKSFI